jgi:hypothetical protein
MDSGERVTVIGLDSQRYQSRQILSNAIGWLGNRQAKRLRSILANVSGPVMVLIHHHVSRPVAKEIGFTDWMQAPFKIAVDGNVLVDILCGYSVRQAGNRVLLVHGHQHEESFQLCEHNGGKVYVYGHPSSTMGIETDGVLDGVIRYALVGFTDTGEWTVRTIAVGVP